MSSMPGIAGDNVIIPWDSSDGKNCTVGFFDPVSGRIVNSYDRQLSSEFLMNYISSGGYSAFAYGKYDINCMELDIVYGGKKSRSISFTSSDINWQKTFPMLDLGDAKILLPYMKTSSGSMNIDGFLPAVLEEKTAE
jgi:hypothetical protein